MQVRFGGWICERKPHVAFSSVGDIRCPLVSFSCRSLIPPLNPHTHFACLFAPALGIMPTTVGDRGEVARVMANLGKKGGVGIGWSGMWTSLCASEERYSDLREQNQI
jgi:hypothetical protein